MSTDRKRGKGENKCRKDKRENQWGPLFSTQVEIFVVCVFGVWGGGRIGVSLLLEGFQKGLWQPFSFVGDDLATIEQYLSAGSFSLFSLANSSEKTETTKVKVMPKNLVILLRQQCAEENEQRAVCCRCRVWGFPRKMWPITSVVLAECCVVVVFFWRALIVGVVKWRIYFICFWFVLFCW